MRLFLFGHHISKGIYDAWHSGDKWERVDAFVTVAIVYSSVATGFFKLVTSII